MGSEQPFNNLKIVQNLTEQMVKLFCLFKKKSPHNGSYIKIMRWKKKLHRYKFDRVTD